jgi:preprotein translocase subunit SecE
MAKGKTKSRRGENRPELVDRSRESESLQTSTEVQDDVENDREEGFEEEAAQGEEEALEGRSTAAVKRASRTTRVGGLAIYKPSQGYYTRVGTAVFAGVIIACFGHFLYSELEVYYEPDKPWTYYMQLGIPFLVLTAMAGLVYWVVGVNRRCCDFMILTEGEMKKVSWSSRKEVIGSTKVVIFTVLAMSLLLFMVDVVFAWFFHVIGVLHVAPAVFGKMMSDAL